MKTHKENNGVSRRALLKGGLAASSSLLLRGLALGLPPGFLLDPSTVNAQTANVRPQTLIFATSSRGDPVNVNCPGSYTNGVENNPHLTAHRGQFGGQRVRAAQPWVDLPEDLRSRLAFFHHQTMSAAHSEHSQTMSLRGAVKNEDGNGQEMLVSMLSQLSQPQLGALQIEPFVLCDQKISYQSQPLQNTNPVQLKSLFSGESDVLNDLRPLRDRALDRLYANLKVNGTKAQRGFLDRFLLGREQSRTLGNRLAEDLERITSEPEEGQASNNQIVAALALAKLNVAPAVVISIPFGRDNHQDSDLRIEAADTVSGVGQISELWRELKTAGLQDRVTFAMLNVFGRRLNRNRRGGRDHNRHHGVMVAFGTGINGGVYGGVNGNGQARNINPNSGRSVNSGGISPEQTLMSAGKSLAAAMGHEPALIDYRIQGGRLVRGFVNS